jgi:hypothetical protein
MKARVFALGFVAVLCSLPMVAQDIPAGPDVWDSLGGGATNLVLSSADWNLLCGVTTGDSAVQLKGFNIPGQGTGDTIINRLNNASLPSIGSSATVNIQLANLSMVSDGSHPCSPLTLRVKPDPNSTQGISQMTITKTSAAGGTFSAKVLVTALIEAVDSSGTVQGSTTVSGALDDTSASPWSYAPPIAAAQAAPWHPGVDPATKKPVRVCRIGNKTLPAQHCYQPRPKCKVRPAPVDTGAARDGNAVIIAVEPCSIEAEPIDPAPTTD